MSSARDSWTDLNLAAKCQEGDHHAWKYFYQHYSSLIMLRIQQVFTRYGYQSHSDDVAQVYDRVIDQFLFGEAWQKFRGPSLKAYVLTITSSRTIDWYRQKTAAKNVYGLEAEPLGDADPEAQEDSAEPVAPGWLSTLTPEERMLTQLLLLCDYTPDDFDLSYLASAAQKPIAQIQSELSELREAMRQRSVISEQKLAQMQLLSLQLQVLERKTDADAETLLKKRAQREDLQAEYRRHGFTSLTPRGAMAALLQWDRGKLERRLAKLKTKLATLLPAHAATAESSPAAGAKDEKGKRHG